MSTFKRQTLTNNYIQIKKIFFVLLLIAFSVSNTFASEYDDRERMIRVDTKLDALSKEVDRRFEEVDRRFTEIDKRFNDL